ncbi:MAG: pyridoxal phosphate-dependent aminotransferase [Oscillospiraceae bacterium]|nr:pyridoxal phosphate-dependent aminotransferase [Oscillospiraceae bacterium]
MISKTMSRLAGNNSAIRAMFEEGNRLAALYGRENVYDFSLGNPNFPAPDAVKDAATDILETVDPMSLHGYMSNAGYDFVRKAIADNLNGRFGTDFSEKNIIMTVGAAGGLNVILKTVLDPGDEVLTFAPYFLEYGNYVSNFGGVLKAVAPNTETFQPNLDAFREMLSPSVKAVIINTPNNPTGVVYSDATLRALGDIMREKESEYGHEIYLISDEPYRELAYEGVEVPYVTKYYDNTFIGYSWSKSLSLPGERIGYVVIPSEMADFNTTFEAASIANRVLGFVNAPSLQQRIVARCLDSKTDLSGYDDNRRTLYNGLTERGFECVFPQGAFYLWMKTPVDDKEFVQAAKEYNILVVPGSSFACPGYVRIAYCVAKSTIVNSMEGFGRLAEKYGLKKV